MAVDAFRMCDPDRSTTTRKGLSVCEGSPFRAPSAMTTSAAASNIRVARISAHPALRECALDLVSFAIALDDFQPLCFGIELVPGMSIQCGEAVRRWPFPSE